jgi:hypothetical protein
MESFICSRLGCWVIISFSKLACLQYFVGGHLGAITPVAPQTIILAPSAWKLWRSPLLYRWFRQ